MKAIIWVVLFSVVASITFSSEIKPLTNSDIVAMLKAGLPESTIVLAIQNSPSDFDKSPQALIALKSAGGTQKIMDAMLAPQTQEAGGPSQNSPPIATEAEVENIVRTMVQNQSQGVISLVSFRKTNGQSGNRDGTPIYTMDFDAVVRFGEDCIWRNINVDEALTFQVARKNSNGSGQGWDQFMYVSQNPGVQVSAGNLFLVKAVVEMTKTENGWVPETIIHGAIEPTSEAVVTQIESSKNSAVISEVHNVSNDELVSLLGQAVPAPEKTDIPFLGMGGKVATVYPAGYSALNVGPDQVNFVSPSKDLIFVVSCAKTGIFGRSLESMVGEMLNSVQSQFPGAEISKVVSSTLAGVDARAFSATIVVDGSVKQRIFVFGVIGKKFLSVSMYAPADKAIEGLGVFRRICAAYKYNSE
jgi:hypothetical protein